jgi:hypothetical protein
MGDETRLLPTGCGAPHVVNLGLCHVFMHFHICDVELGTYHSEIDSSYNVGVQQ